MGLHYHVRTLDDDGGRRRGFRSPASNASDYCAALPVGSGRVGTGSGVAADPDGEGGAAAEPDPDGAGSGAGATGAGAGGGTGLASFERQAARSLNAFASSRHLRVAPGILRSTHCSIIFLRSPSV